jgi:AcrR family transcriptional regulator
MVAVDTYRAPRRSDADPLPPGAQRLLEAAIAVLDEHGAAALRLTDIAARAGVSFGLIGHHFGNREGLVAAAQRARLEGMLKTDIGQLAELTAPAAGAADVERGLRALSAELVDGSRTDARFGRVAALATAHGQPEARGLIAEVTAELLDRMEGLIQVLQARGIVRRDLDARAIATFAQAYGLGMVLSDLDPTPPTPDAMVAVIMTALTSFFDDAPGEVETRA